MRPIYFDMVRLQNTYIDTVHCSFYLKSTSQPLLYTAVKTLHTDTLHQSLQTLVITADM